jgi:hypothetical protein
MTTANYQSALQSNSPVMVNLRISAPPIADVVVYPLMKLIKVLAAKAPAAIIGLPGAIVIKAPIVAALVASKPELITWRPGKSLGFDDILPASFMNATMEPVKVIPPIQLSAWRLSVHSRGFTNENSEISCYQVKRCYVSKVSHDTTNASQDSRKTDNGVKSSDSLGKVGRGNSLADEHS